MVLYRCAADSAPFARKQLDYGSERTAPAFDFEDARSGFAEGLTRDARGLTVFARAGARRADAHASRSTAIGAARGRRGLRRIRARALGLAASAAPRSNVPFLVPSLLDSVNFRVRKVGEASIDGEAASVIRLSLAGPLGWFLPDIDVSYRKRDRRLHALSRHSRTSAMPAASC